MMGEGIELGKHWGFEYKTVFLVWEKLNKTNGNTSMGLGWYSRSCAEFVLVFTVGRAQRLKKSTEVRQLIRCRKGRHSEKPNAARLAISRFVGDSVPTVELFARKKYKDWVVWGNEIPVYDDESGTDDD
jgi:N6-adenosine-specific RNA methylase IME4